MKLNSIIFHTNKLSEVREFYENKLNLTIGTFIRENLTVPDCSDSYVNYHLDGGALLCFETEVGRVDIGTIVLNVESLPKFRKHLEQIGIEPVGGNEHFIKIKDPEGRSLIIEQVR